MLYRFLFVLGLAICGTAVAQAVAATGALAGVQPATVTLIVIVLSSMLAHWFTALTKSRFATEGRATQLLAGLFSALIGGYVTWASGSYGHGWVALGIAVLVSLVTWAAADAQWQGKVQAATAALRGVQQNGGLATIILQPTTAPTASALSPTPPVDSAPAETAGLTPATWADLQAVPQPASELAPATPEPTGPATPPPDSIPAPVEAAPAPQPTPEETMNTQLLTILGGLLNLSAATPAAAAQKTALDTWTAKNLPLLLNDVQSLGASFSLGHASKLIDDAVKGAQELKGIFEGTDRAKIAAALERFVVDQAAPVSVRFWLDPIMASGELEDLNEAAFQRFFGPAAVPPVVNASELPSGEAVR